MAEIAHAGVGIDLDIKGIDKARELNGCLRDIPDLVKDVINVTKQMDYSIGMMSNKGRSNIGKITDAVKDVIVTSRMAADGFRRTQDNISALRPSGIDNVNSAVKNTTNSVREMRNTISNVAKNANSDVKSITSTTNGATDAVKRLGGSFEPIKPRITEIHEPLGKLHDQLNNLSIPMDSFRQRFHNSSGRVNGDIDETRSNVHKLHSNFMGLSTIIGGNLISNSIVGAWNSVIGKIKEATSAGMEYDKEQQKMVATWTTLTGNISKANRMTSTINQLSVKTGQSADLVNEIEQGFYHLHSNKGESDTLTKSMLNMSDAVGLDVPRIQAVTQDMVNGLSRGTANGGMLNQISQYFPMFRENLAKYETAIHHGQQVTTSDLVKMAKHGQITAKDIENVFNRLGDGKYGKAADNMLKTMVGMQRTIHARVPALMGAFEKPIMKAKNPFFGAVSKWVSDKRTETEFNRLGKTTSKGINTIVTAFSRAYNTKNGTKVLDNMTISIGKGITSMSNSIARNANHIKDFFSMTKSAGVGSIKLFASTLKDLSIITFPLLNFAVKHIKIVAPLLAGLFVTKKVAGFANGIVTVSKNLKLATGVAKLFGTQFKDNGKILSLFSKKSIIVQGAMKAWAGITKAFTFVQKAFDAALAANPIGLIVVAITATIAVLVELYRHFKPFREFVNGLGRGIKKAFKGIASWSKGIASKVGHTFRVLRTNVGKYFRGTAKDIGKVSKDSIHTQKDKLRIFSDIFHGRFKNLKRDIPRYYKDMFKTIKDIGKTYYNFLNKLTGGKLGDMVDIFKKAFKEVRKVWDDAWNGIGHFFEGIWDWIRKIVGKGVNSVIGVMNMGIGGIDDVISTFGGSKTAIHKIDDVHYARGTGLFSSQRNPILKPTFATLNDGNDSPSTGNKEMVLHANGVSELIQGRNTKKWLEPGAEVLNASETSFLMGQHFAKGTGFFGNLWNGAKSIAGDVWSGAKDLAGSIGHEIAEMTKILAHPIKFFESMFSSPNGLKGIMQEFGGGLWNKGTDAAKNWWNTLIHMADQARDDSGGSSSLLRAVEKYGRGNRYVLGGTGPTTFDCSGLVQYALDHAFGIHYPRTSGEQINYAQHVPSGQEKPGDLVGNAGHIGVYAGHGQYWAAASPSAHPNIGMWPVSAFPDGPYKFGRVRGIKDTSKHDKNAGNGLEKLIKSQTGGFLKWIQKHLGAAFGGAGNPVGDGVQKWIPLVKKAASEMGVSLGDGGMQAVLHRIQQESNGNPTVTNNWDSNAAAGNASVGLVQYTPTTFRSWAVKGHDVLTNGFDQLLALFNDSNWLSDISAAGGWGPTGHRRRARGGHVLKGQSYLVGEEGQEIFKPNEDGQIIPHNESKRMISNMNKHSTISYNPQIIIKGDASEKTISLISHALENHGDKLMDMLEDRMGFNDDGGLNI